MSRHPLAEEAGRVLPASADVGRYLQVLDERFTALEELAAGRSAEPAALRGGRRERALARRVLGPLEAAWDDGDETLVRGFLDRWLTAGVDPRQAAARNLVEAGHELRRLQARPATWWFFLWEMESMMRGLASAANPRRSTVD